jgi:hypothetical protein
MADKRIRDATNELTQLESGDLFETDRPTEDIFYKFEADNLREQMHARDLTQASHGFAAGDAVHHNGTSWEKADATGLTGKPCHAVVLDAPDANTFYMAATGLHTITAHGISVGQNYLSTTPGAVSTSQAGPGNIRQRVLVALDANTLLLTIGDPLP